MGGDDFGFVDVGGIGVSYGDIVDQTITDVSSWVTDFGQEYLGFPPTELGIDAYSSGQVGDFAGSSEWFTATYPGEIVSQVPEGFSPVTGGVEGVTTNLVSQDFSFIGNDPTAGGLFTEVNGTYVLTSELNAENFSSTLTSVQESLLGPTQLGGPQSGFSLGSIVDSAKNVASSIYKDVSTFVGNLTKLPTALNPNQYGSAGYTWPGASGVIGTPFDDGGVLNVGWKVDELGQPYYVGSSINTGVGLNILSESETQALFGKYNLVNTFVPTVSGTDPNVLNLLKTTAKLVGINPNIVTAGAVTANDPSVANLIKLASSTGLINNQGVPTGINPYQTVLIGAGNVQNYLPGTVNAVANPQISAGAGSTLAANQIKSSTTFTTTPAYTTSYNPETGDYSIVSLTTGQVVASGLTSGEASQEVVMLNAGGEGALPATPITPPAGELAYPNNTTAPTADPQAYPNGPSRDDEGNLLPGWAYDENTGDYYIGNVNNSPYIDPSTQASADASRQQALLDVARQQATLKAMRKQDDTQDWRVRLSLAPLSTYLYNAPNPGVLQPLRNTNGVIFPYTPQIQTVYKANYSNYDLTHSNYRGFFYQGSVVEDVQLTATFTAQDTAEANYLLAVITFFKSITKMFYGQDAERGAPPPLVYLSGLGEYQFAAHPCAVAQFNYNLPADVDYIRANSANINGTNLLQRRSLQDLPTNPVTAALYRLANAGAQKGAIPNPPAPPSLSTGSPTYVPTKMEISLILHPMQTRQQVSQQFSLKSFANGDLIKGGFW